MVLELAQTSSVFVCPFLSVFLRFSPLGLSPFDLRDFDFDGFSFCSPSSDLGLDFGG